MLLLINIFSWVIKAVMNMSIRTTERPLKGAFVAIKHDMKLITTNDAAERLGVTVQRIHALIKDGRLPAERLGRDYVINEEDLALVAERKPGRPPLTDEEKAERAEKKAAAAGAQTLPFEPRATKPRAKKAGVKKSRKKISPKK